MLKITCESCEFHDVENLPWSDCKAGIVKYGTVWVNYAHFDMHYKVFYNPIDESQFLFLLVFLFLSFPAVFWFDGWQTRVPSFDQK